MTTPITESALYQTIHRQPADWRGLLARDSMDVEAFAQPLSTKLGVADLRLRGKLKGRIIL